MHHPNKSRREPPLAKAGKERQDVSAMSMSRGKERPGRLGNPFFAGLRCERTAEAQGVVNELFRERGVIVWVNVPRHGRELVEEVKEGSRNASWSNCRTRRLGRGECSEGGTERERGRGSGRCRGENTGRDKPGSRKSRCSSGVRWSRWNGSRCGTAPRRRGRRLQWSMVRLR